MQQEIFGIGSFRSRQQVMRFEAALRRAGIRSQVISTPRDVSVGCGLSVRFDLKDAAAVVFSNFQQKGEERKILDEFIPAYAKTLNCPVVAGYPYGHCPRSYLIDFFREVEITADGVVKW